jgi:vitamin K-dependent gamma-carboxylase-like protein
MSAAWNRFWHRPAPAVDLAAARILLAAVGLWMVLSRHDLPSMLAFPAELWRNVTPERRLRFLMVLPLPAERLLYWVLHGTLLCALLGVRARAACFVSGVLLYHFAPFETIIRTANPYLRGFTLPCLGLLVLSFARCGDALTLGRLAARAGSESRRESLGGSRHFVAAPPNPRAARAAALATDPAYRWPLALVQVLLCELYFFAGWSKLATTGWSWLQAGNIRGHLLVLNQALTADPVSSWGYALARHPTLCALLAWTGLAFELAFPLVLFSVNARRVLLPLAVVFHGANSVLFRIFFQNVPLLLLFVPWDRVRQRVRAWAFALRARPEPELAAAADRPR